jgi:hypothetical protein
MSSNGRCVCCSGVSLSVALLHTLKSPVPCASMVTAKKRMTACVVLFSMVLVWLHIAKHSDTFTQLPS